MKLNEAKLAAGLYVDAAAIERLGDKEKGFCSGFLGKEKSTGEEVMVKVNDTGVNPSRPYSASDYAANMAINAAKEAIGATFYTVAGVKVPDTRLTERPLTDDMSRLTHLLGRFTKAVNAHDINAKPPASPPPAVMLQPAEARAAEPVTKRPRFSLGLKLDLSKIPSRHEESDKVEKAIKELQAKPVTMVISTMIPGFIDFSKATVGTRSVMKHVKAIEQFPTEITHDGHTFSLHDTGKMLAVAKFLGDADAVGVGGGNCGFVAGADGKARVCKIDTGQFLESIDTMIGKSIKIGGSEDSGMVCVNVDKMPPEQRKEFDQTMKSLVAMDTKDLRLIVSRNGQFDRAASKDWQEALIGQLQGRQKEMAELYGLEQSQGQNRSGQLPGPANPAEQLQPRVPSPDVDAMMKAMVGQLSPRILEGLKGVQSAESSSSTPAATESAKDKVKNSLSSRGGGVTHS